MEKDCSFFFLFRTKEPGIEKLTIHGGEADLRINRELKHARF